MATVDKQIADDIVAGKYPEDGWVKIVKYTNMAGEDAYGCVHPSDDPFNYRASEFVRNPVEYWRKPGYIEPGLEITVFIPPHGKQQAMTILCNPEDAQWFRDHNVKVSAEQMNGENVLYADVGLRTPDGEPNEIMVFSRGRNAIDTMADLRIQCEGTLKKHSPKEPQ